MSKIGKAVPTSELVALATITAMLQPVCELEEGFFFKCELLLTPPRRELSYVA